MIAVGKITTSCLPGHHHPCIVNATQVATDHPTTAQRRRRNVSLKRSFTVNANAGMSAKMLESKESNRTVDLKANQIIVVF